ncbi:hypothetical protein [Streptococcus uberis]|uniref:hypothetical protein n=1 Tax=Streptococcus uberis TaxID=1349 RepID=UPI0006212F8D|nr:hypothetical protein [Streptococcus uberis]QBX12108.1 hypothetical protein JavanS634_0015 [Streptococcus satellite phage Javan634]KKF41389.1 hypothetical protein AF61_01990 [Streptococcus uberis EF20/0145]MCK1197448.1 hypothetical protein [Streptococcus uberis]MCK1206310.1 hypothetical protein [Streptococcus uberis]MCK1239904.1 hypothetical protein [Streptococcus uberis]
MSGTVSISHIAEKGRARMIWNVKEKDRRPTFTQIKERQQQKKLKKKRNRGK